MKRTNNERADEIDRVMAIVVGPGWTGEPSRDCVVDVLANLCHWFERETNSTMMIPEETWLKMCRVAHDHYDVEREEEYYNERDAGYAL